MPGIAGVAKGREGGLEREDSLLEVLREVQALRGVTLAERSFTTSTCIASSTTTGLVPGLLEQPAVGPGGAQRLLLEGEVYNLPELRGLVREPFGSTLGETLLALFMERGPDCAALLDGTFNLLVHDERSGRLTVLNDRLSARPFYYAEEEGRLLFASEKKCILSLARRAPRLDPVGLLQIFVHRHNVLGRTFVEGLRRLPPSGVLTFEGGRLAVRARERLRFRPAERMESAKDLLEEWAARLEADVARRVRGRKRLLLNLSGGLDSRAVACAIPRDVRPVAARTRGRADSTDFRRAAEVAARLGFDHYREDPGDVAYSRLLPRAIWRAECEVPLLHCLSLAGHREMKARGDLILGGQCGDVLSGGHIHPYLLRPAGRDAFLDRAFARYSTSPLTALEDVFRRELLDEHLPAVRRLFRESFAFDAGETNADAYQSWDLRERQPRGILSPGAVDTHLFEKLYPLLGKDHLELALRLPLRLRLGQVLYGALIARLGPEVRGVPSANTGRRLRPSIAGNRLDWLAELSGKALRSGWRKARGVRHRVAEGEEGLSSALREDPSFRRWIEAFLASDACDPDVFNREGVRGLILRHESGREDHAHVLSLVAGFALGISYFLANRPRACPEEAQASD